ncbi:MAG: flagellar hook protein FlgE [Hydrogenophaga sp.]|uniref:flagellar hook protein FlgE n=1 Tax=Hydrogenophaga sp. TaxID=1904254 RepID=UPI003D9B867C
MAFQQGLSGINAASRNLDVIGHNVANASTVGMKASRAEFAELYASSIGSSGGVNSGIGVTVAKVTQLFTQGNVTVTGNDLDVAINGSGFYELTMPNGTMAYSRAGMFKLNNEGEIVNNQGSNLMGYPTDEFGTRLSFTTQPLSLPTGGPIPANKTSKIETEFNLDARAPIFNTVTPNTPLSQYGTSVVAYDPQGLEVPVGLAFQKTANNEWTVYRSVNGGPLAQSTPPTVLRFKDDGTLNTATSTMPPITLASPNNPAVTFSATLDYGNATQFGIDFAVTNLTQDGYRPGELTSLKIDEGGVITASYSNGQTRAAGQIALVNFRNVQGLQPTGNGNWEANYATGEPVHGAPGEGKFGGLRSGALEDSNIDITGELVAMMSAQRAYQANAQTIKTQDQVLSTMLNMR